MDEDARKVHDSLHANAKVFAPRKPASQPSSARLSTIGTIANSFRSASSRYSPKGKRKERVPVGGFGARETMDLRCGVHVSLEEHAKSRGGSPISFRTGSPGILRPTIKQQGSRKGSTFTSLSPGRRASCRKLSTTKSRQPTIMLEASTYGEEKRRQDMARALSDEATPVRTGGPDQALSDRMIRLERKFDQIERLLTANLQSPNPRSGAPDTPLSASAPSPNISLSLLA